MRIRIEKGSPGTGRPDWRAITYVLAADDLYAVQSERTEGEGPDSRTYQASYTYDRHHGIPVLRSIRPAFESPSGSRGTSELKVVERQFGPIAEEEFDPDRFLDGPQVKEMPPDVNVDESSRLQRWYWLPLPIGARPVRWRRLRSGLGRIVKSSNRRNQQYNRRPLPRLRV